MIKDFKPIHVTGMHAPVVYMYVNLQYTELLFVIEMTDIQALGVLPKAIVTHSTQFVLLVCLISDITSKES